jgi:Putative MetA-pathway of phenol degradation
MAKKITLSFIFLYSGFISFSQQNRIDTDRPDQTESSGIVPKNYFQAEIGFNKENTYNNNYDLLHPTSLLKYGLGGIELRLQSVFLSSYEQYIPQPRWTTGLEPVEIGIKVALAEEKKILPQTSLIVHVGIPTFASRSFRYDHLAPTFKLTMQKTLSSWAGIGANLGVAWDGTSSNPAWLYTFSPGFNVGQNWYTYIEAFGFIKRNELPQHNLDGGIAYYITNNTKIDISAGAGISKASPKNYVALGFSFRIDTKHHPDK